MQSLTTAAAPFMHVENCMGRKLSRLSDVTQLECTANQVHNRKSTCATMSLLKVHTTTACNMLQIAFCTSGPGSDHQSLDGTTQTSSPVRLCWAKSLHALFASEIMHLERLRLHVQSTVIAQTVTVIP